MAQAVITEEDAQRMRDSNNLFFFEHKIQVDMDPDGSQDTRKRKKKGTTVEREILFASGEEWSRLSPPQGAMQVMSSMRLVMVNGTSRPHFTWLDFLETMPDE